MHGTLDRDTARNAERDDRRGLQRGRARAASAPGRAPTRAHARSARAGPRPRGPAHHALYQRPEAGEVSDYARMTIHEIAPLLQSGTVSPVELTREMLDRIERIDPRLHAFITLRPEQALADARAAE